MKNWLRYTLVAVFTAGFAVGTGFLVHSTREHDAMLCCNRMDVEFGDEYRFVGEEDIRQLVEAQCGNPIGLRLDSVNLARIEAGIKTRSAVRSCEAWTTKDGVLHLSVRQRKPVVRFVDGEDGYYSDAEAVLFPLPEGYEAEVHEVSGKADGDLEWIRKVISMLNYMDVRPEISSMVTSMRAAKDGELTLGSRDSTVAFIFGQPEDYAAKFARMKEYYDYIDGQEQGYKTVNLKYKGQIICRKGI